MITARIMRKHINRDRTQPDPITLALKDEGFDDIQIESHWNLIPPNHDWAVWINGKRFSMTYDLRRYYGDWAIHDGSRTRYAELRINKANGTADIFAPLRTKNAPFWVRHGITEKEWYAARKENERRAAESRRNGYRPTSPASLQAEIDSLPDGHWLKAKDMSKWTPDQRQAYFNKEESDQ